MKSVLFVSFCNPFAPYSGADQRTALLLEALLSRYAVDTVSFTNDPLPASLPKNCTAFFYPPVEHRHTRLHRIHLKIKQMFTCDLWYLPDPKACEIVRDMLRKRKYEAIICRYIETACVCGLQNYPDLVVDVDDLPEQSAKTRIKLSSNLIRKTTWCIHYFQAKRYTKTFLSNIRVSFLPDKDKCKAYGAYYLPNIPYGRKSAPDKKPFDACKDYMLFVGYMGWPPNIRGIDRFIERIFPLVREKVPTATLRIAGKGLPEKYRKRWNTVPGVEILGFVESLDALYRECKVFVAPIYQGGGTNIKVLEAMKYGCPVVCSPYATRGMEGIAPGKNCFVASSDREFADAVCKLLRERETNEFMAGAARETVNRYYSREIFYRAVENGLAALRTKIIESDPTTC